LVIRWLQPFCLGLQGAGQPTEERAERVTLGIRQGQGIQFAKLGGLFRPFAAVFGRSARADVASMVQITSRLAPIEQAGRLGVLWWFRKRFRIQRALLPSSARQ